MLMSVGRSVSPSVRPSVRWSVDQVVSNHYLETILDRAFIFHMLIGLGKDKNPIDFGFTRSKVKVTSETFVKKINCFLRIILRTNYHRAFIFYMLIGLGKNMTCIDF